MSARRVVTLPDAVRGVAAEAFAQRACQAGAQLLEVRSDLHAPSDIDPGALARILPLLVSLRGAAVPAHWQAAAELLDLPLEACPEAGSRATVHRGPALLVSHHAEVPLSPDQAVALWRARALDGVQHVKHVEPLGAPGDFARLFRTRDALARHCPGAAITVLAIGPLALPFRCVLASGNALDYLAVSPEFLAAPGQRLLADAAREARAGLRPEGRHRERLGILGAGIGGSRSPRVHPQPFDRLELPPDAPLDTLLPALLPHYRGFAVTSPFKRAAAKALGSPLEAVNTLWREGASYRSANTDVAGARAVLERLGATKLTFLGDGGATVALREAARALGIEHRVLTRAQVAADPARARVAGAVVWTWPDGVLPPPGLDLSGAEVALIVYGAQARRLATQVRALGGTPLPLGPRWFVAQAREQRRLWEGAK